MIYEQFVGCPPFFNGQADTQKLITMITTKSVFFPTKEKHNIDMSDDARDFISKLLQKDPAQRLGTQGGLQEILEHPWLKDYDIEALKNKQVEIPADEKPKLSEERLDMEYFPSEFREKKPRESLIGAK